MGAVTAIAKRPCRSRSPSATSRFYNGRDPNIALLVGANSPIKTAKDLAGQILADVSLEDMNSVSTFKWLEEHGVDHTSVKYVEIPASASAGRAIEANRVAGTTVYEPYYSAYMKTGKVRILGYPFDAIGPRFSGAVLFTPTQWAADHPDLVQRFLRAVSEASVYVAAHEDEEAAQLVATFGGLDPATIAHIPHGGRGVANIPSDLQPVIDVAAKYKVIPEDFPAAKIICSCALRR